MEKYKLTIKPSASKELESIPKKDLKRIIKRIGSLADNPRPPGCEKLSNLERYRVRQGNYRVVYGIDEKDRNISVVKIAHRREVYRQ